MGLQNLFKNKVIKNAGWIIGGRVINKILAFVVGILTARYLGPNNYGLINYAAAYTTFFASVCTLGINSIIVKNFVDHPGEEGTTIGTTLLLRALSSFLSAVMIIGIVSVVDRGEPLTITVVALSSLGLLFQIFDTLNYWFQARLQSKYSAMASIVSYAGVSIYKLYLLIQGKSVTWFAIATALDYLVLAIFLLGAYFKHGGTHFYLSKTKAKELLSSSKSFIVAGLMVSIYASTDKFMLKQMLSDAEVGYYSMAVSICNTWVFILAAIIDSLYPSILQSFGDRAQFERKNKQLYAIVFYISIVVSILLSIFASPLVRALYGDAYLPTTDPLRIITWYTGFSYLGVARNAWIISYNKQGCLKYLYFGSAVTNVLLNLILIPRLGTSGAALASLMTQMSTIFVFPALLKDLRPNVKLMMDAVRLKDLF